MKKYYLLGICADILIVLLIIVVVFLPKINNLSQKLELTYKINSGIPFKWVYEIEDPEIVGFEKSYVSKDENVGEIVGVPIYTNYVFKGLKEGTTTIIFKMVNATGEFDNVVKQENNKVKVDSNNNITLVAKVVEE